MHQRIYLFTEGGIEILYLDFSYLKGSEFIRTIEAARDFILALPGDQEHPSVTDLRGAKINHDVRHAMKRMAEEIKLKKGRTGKGITIVVIGLSVLERLVAGAVTPDITYLDNKEAGIRAILRNKK